mgnify:CR=1 FL=1
MRRSLVGARPRRSETVVMSMIQDALTAMVTNDREMAADVVQRDDDVDRLYLLVSRQFTEILRSGSLKEESIDPITAFNYTRAATNLERMADHASRIADMILQCDCTLPAEVAEGMGRISPQLLSLIEDSISSLLLLNSGKANEGDRAEPAAEEGDDIDGFLRQLLRGARARLLRWWPRASAGSPSPSGT